MAYNEYTTLVFGTTGISGWAVSIMTTRHPSTKASNTISRVIGLTNRALSKESLSAESRGNKRWDLHSGIDLEQDADAVAEKLEAVRDVDQFWTLQTGGKAYGVELLDKGIKYNPPLKESAPPIPEPWASNVFYYAQYDTVKLLSEGKRWEFCEIRPDAFIGFVPQNNAMNLVQAIGLWLAMVRSFEELGTEVVFSGDEKAYKALQTNSSQDILAQFHVYASLHPDVVSKKAPNIADGEVVTWEQVCPDICHWSGLKGVERNPLTKTGAEGVQE
ncbi:MAG: hypothetical protein Q9175_008249 [Cornicularia normoerica]